ncbi:MAG: TonB-dependent receptor [Flavobacteriaceae bacterium]|nr:TonB-dependent receptor [Flavobacteriaceae bacterium]
MTTYFYRTTVKLAIVSGLLWMAHGTLWAQSLSGYVLDDSQQPIQEAYIFNKTTEQHTHSDEMGYFILENASVGDTLQFSHLSYQTEQWVINELQTPLTVILFSKSIALSEIVITPRLNALNIITDIDTETNPVNSSQDVLRKVPGLVIGQHAGGGKAEQIFLRGFDIDHGTDINITVDGLPVNMVSHAHGQGYADLHFVIPETLENIDFGKGPYYGNKGNFATAGYVDFRTRRKLENSTIKLEAGQFDTYRLLGMFNLLKNTNHNAYIASEFILSDGPFESPQNFNRTNLFAKYNGLLSDKDRLGITASHFTSGWDASGQIPERAVNSGLIGRFGAIDDTEGGTTSRSNVLIDYDKRIDDRTSLYNKVYWSRYDFELFSNFTFFLEDPINGDQIKQREKRNLYGLQSEYERKYYWGEYQGNWKAGISLRQDQSDNNELSRTLNRSETLEQLQLGTINETNAGAYLESTLHLGKWTINPAIRADYFNFKYNDGLLDLYETQNETQTIVSPKLNILFNPSDKLQLYAKSGKGFHSNDTRVVVAQRDEKTLPAAYGLDLGFIGKLSPKMILNMAYWHLYLEQEFVYVGDAGIVEPSGKTRRSGLELSYRYQPLNWLSWNLDANYVRARAIEESSGNDYIPLAPEFTLTSGVSVNHPSGWFGSIEVRYLDDRPANEDNSIVAKGYTVTDLNLGYQWKNLSFGVQIQNILDTDWNETQFATESRLQNELNPVEEIHFTPGTPFFLKTSIQYSF